MYHFLYKFYFFKFRNRQIDRVYHSICIRLINFYLSVTFRLLPLFPKQFLNGKKCTEPYSILVSLTSFPGRIDIVWKTIFSILKQRIRPNGIILWLFRGEFKGLDALPEKLKLLQLYGLQIRFCDINLKPHKKYFYALEAFPDMHLITIDDDTIYPPSYIENLIKAKRQHPDCIISAICRSVSKDESGNLLPYRQWNYVLENTGPSLDLLPIGVGGPLYYPGCFAEEVTNVNELQKIAPTTDDLWLKAMSLLNGVRVYCNAGDYNRFFVPIPQRHGQRLMDTNVRKGVNDTVIKQLTTQYKVFI